MRSVLVASRGALAIRTVDACRRLGLFSIAVAAAADPQRLHVRGADACVMLDGSSLAQTYDSVEAIVAAASRSGASQVHPGCGALAENPELPRRLAELGIGFVGPRAPALQHANDKRLAVAAAERLGIPVLPHAWGPAAIASLVADVGFPLVLKPAAGCLGEGVRVVRTATELLQAMAAGGDGCIWYAERYVACAQGVAVTLATDAHGTVVELGERETLLVEGSLKLLDASPVRAVESGTMARIRHDATRLAVALGLTNVATFEFIAEGTGYAFIEVNGRLAGGYRMCEAQTGIDVVVLQLALAEGETLSDARIAPDQGVACLEARVYLRPACNPPGVPGRVERLHLAPEPGVTYDCAIDESCLLGFDRILAQILAVGESREMAADRLLRAVEGSELRGVPHYRDDIARWVRLSCSGCGVRPAELSGV